MTDGSGDCLRQRLKEKESLDLDDEDIAKLTDDIENSKHDDENVRTQLPQSTDKTSEIIDDALKDFTPRWRNWVIRGIFTWAMIFAFALIIYFGPPALVIMIMLLQFKCFHEIISIGYVVYRSHELPWFRTLSWYFLAAANYFFYGESLISYYTAHLSRLEFLQPLVTYHRFISFSLYCAGIVAFVFSLVKTHYLRQFTLFGWTHVTLLIIVSSSHMLIQNIFEGLVWFLLPVSMIVCNDIMAYLFGFFFGRTPLIKLSPKKTWEGYIGGAVSTVVFGLLMSLFLLQYDYFVCPMDYDYSRGAFIMECERSRPFILAQYKLPTTLIMILKTVGIPWTTVNTYPLLFHSLAMSMFASIIGPFGGFFASGFKRAFKIKDFGDTIPGHGGIVDRIDCQLLMGAFVNVYHHSFVRMPDPAKLWQIILTLRPEQQIELYRRLDNFLNRTTK